MPDCIIVSLRLLCRVRSATSDCSHWWVSGSMEFSVISEWVIIFLVGIFMTRIEFRSPCILQDFLTIWATGAHAHSSTVMLLSSQPSTIDGGWKGKNMVCASQSESQSNNQLLTLCLLQSFSFKTPQTIVFFFSSDLRKEFSFFGVNSEPVLNSLDNFLKSEISYIYTQIVAQRWSLTSCNPMDLW